MITGPPASGKTLLSEKLSKFYNLPHLTISNIVEYGINLVIFP
jgi:adenylate kinase family enzyme